jgi:hypothetical protein
MGVVCVLSGICDDRKARNGRNVTANVDQLRFHKDNVQSRGSD